MILEDKKNYVYFKFGVESSYGFCKDIVRPILKTVVLEVKNAICNISLYHIDIATCFCGQAVKAPA